MAVSTKCWDGDQEWGGVAVRDARAVCARRGSSENHMKSEGGCVGAGGSCAFSGLGRGERRVLTSEGSAFDLLLRASALHEVDRQRGAAHGGRR